MGVENNKSGNKKTNRYRKKYPKFLRSIENKIKSMTNCHTFQRSLI
jgi:hypothetical protein